jgi:hypothetical protein
MPTLTLEWDPPPPLPEADDDPPPPPAPEELPPPPPLLPQAASASEALTARAPNLITRDTRKTDRLTSDFVRDSPVTLAP